jgi:hypothetical protein
MNIRSISNTPIVFSDTPLQQSTERIGNSSPDTDHNTRDSFATSDDIRQLSHFLETGPSLLEARRIKKQHMIEKHVDAERYRAISQLSSLEQQHSNARAEILEHVRPPSAEHRRLREMQLEEFKRMMNGQTQWPNLVNRYL